MSEWQPISTAPRDGTPVLLYDADTGDMMCGEFVSPAETFTDAPDVLLGYPWRCTVEPSSAYSGDAFTHWMPLPDRPSPL